MAREMSWASCGWEWFVAITDDHMIREYHAGSPVWLLAFPYLVRRNTTGDPERQKVGAKIVLVTSNSDDLKEQCDELVLVAVTKHLAQGNNISPQFPVLVAMDIFYAHYMDLDRDHRSQIFGINTLSALEENQEEKEHES